MAQAAFPFDTTPIPAAAPVAAAAPDPSAPAHEGWDRTGFDIGWDHAHHRLTPPVKHLHPAHPVRLGWQAGQAAFGRRTLRATPAVRLWLALRLHAWERGRAFEDVQVTPHFLSRIASSTCPITREPLTQGTGRSSDASVDRVRDDAGYAAGNLVVMSRRANRAKGALSCEQALDNARRIRELQLGHIDGLGAAEWARLGTLMSLVTPLPHQRVATLPLVALPPVRLRVMNPAQALQAMLTLQFLRPGYAQRVAALAELMPRGEVRQAYQILMNTLLARRLASGAADGDSAALRMALEDAWALTLVAQRWERLALRLSEADCERILLQAAQRGLSRGEWRWLDLRHATEGWALETRGFVPGQRPLGAPGAAVPEPETCEVTLPLVRPLSLPAAPLPTPAPRPEPQAA
jgi:hypothetical protein